MPKAIFRLFAFRFSSGCFYKAFCSAVLAGAVAFFIAAYITEQLALSRSGLASANVDRLQIAFTNCIITVVGSNMAICGDTSKFEIRIFVTSVCYSESNELLVLTLPHKKY